MNQDRASVAASLPAELRYLLSPLQLSLHGPNLRELEFPGYHRVETVLDVSEHGKLATNKEELDFGFCIGADVVVSYVGVWQGSMLKQFLPLDEPVELHHQVGARFNPGGLRITHQ